MEGITNLHDLTWHEYLDCFILISSVPSPSGACPAGATIMNSFSDCLALHRQQQGLPGQALTVLPDENIEEIFAETLARPQDYQLVSPSTLQIPLAAQEYSEELASEVAIIGMACRFPRSNNPKEFWDRLLQGQSCITDIPPDRWNVDNYYSPNLDAPDKMYTRKGGFIVPPVGHFDAAFFQISPTEATVLDPQQRLLLEIVWETMEDASVNPKDLKNCPTGVFVGISTHDYHTILSDIGTHGPYVTIGNTHSTASGRLSYTFGFQGPAVSVDTACSSSLVAVQMACQSLGNGESEVAFAGGVNLLLHPTNYINFCKAKMLSPDGYCKSFDATANGYARGEGAGLVLLKKLGASQKDGNKVLALVKGWAVNQDGASSSFTAPNGVAQERVIRQALVQANLQAKDISFIETHGTGTPLGDPIEVNALKNVMSEGRQPNNFLTLGTAKVNVGHLESASGIAGLIKVILSLQNQWIPQHLHFTTLNPKIDFEASFSFL